jgi:hypothetical protein
VTEPPCIENSQRRTRSRSALFCKRYNPTESVMKILNPTMMLVILTAWSFAGMDATAAEKFHKLTASQIRDKLAGMEISDETHWGDVYGRNGTVTTYSMGHKSVGKWSVRKDELCIDKGKEPGGGCYEVWLSENKVKLRQQGIELPLEGVLQKPTDTW